MEDDALNELWRVKEEIAKLYGSVGKIASAARRLNKTHPLPAAGSKRKTIDGVPLGQSVADDDATMAELRKVKEELSTQPISGLSNKLKSPGRARVKHTWKKNSFGTVGSPMAKKIGRGKH